MFLPIGDQPNPRGTPWVNYLLLGLNIAVFLGVSLPLMLRPADPSDPLVLEYLRLLMRQNPGVSEQVLLAQMLQDLSAYDFFVMRWGYRPADPSLVTVLTSMFLHGSALHLAGNMLFLWIYGDNVEHRLGRWAYLAAYLATGTAATLGYALLAPGQDGLVPMVGASGAISGVLGLYFIWFPRNKVRVFVLLFPFYVDVWHIGARWVLGFYLVAENLLPFFWGSGGSVAYGAHIGGFIAGMAGAALLNQWSTGRHRHAASEDQEQGVGANTAREPLSQHLESREAARLYWSLSPTERRAQSVEAMAEAADRLAEQGAHDQALALYQQLWRDHPRGPGLDRVFLGMGLTLLYGEGRPTAAYQYLMDGLDVAPRPEVEQRLRQAIAHIESLQKHQVHWRRSL
jgi:membrane associated rhomboid family serine protease